MYLFGLSDFLFLISTSMTGGVIEDPMHWIAKASPKAVPNQLGSTTIGIEGHTETRYRPYAKPIIHKGIITKYDSLALFGSGSANKIM